MRTLPEDLALTIADYYLTRRCQYKQGISARAKVTGFILLAHCHFPRIHPATSVTSANTRFVARKRTTGLPTVTTPY